MLSALIQSDEGVNAVWVFLKSLEQAMQTLSSKESNDVADLRDSLSGANDYTDKAVNKLYTYVDAMNGGVGGLIDSTSYDPSGLPTDKPCTLIALGSGTFTNLKDVNNTAITVSQSNSITVFFRAAHITYWNYKTEVLTAPPMDDTPTNGNTTHVVSSDGVYDFVMEHGIDNVDVADVTGSDYLKDRIVYSMRKNMGTVSEPDYEIIAEFTIPIATATKAGLMPAYVDGVFDVNRYVGSTTPYDSLSQVLSNAATLIPTAVRRGGMSIKFIQSSDNKYVQYRYMGTSTAAADFTNVGNWQGVDDEPAATNNLVKSNGVYKDIQSLSRTEPNYITHKQILSDGAIGDVTANTRFISCHIPAQKGDVIEWSYNTASTNIGLGIYKSDDTPAGNSYSGVNGNGVRTFTLAANDIAYIIGTFVIADGYTPYIKVNGVTVWTKQGKGRVTLLEERMTSAESGITELQQDIDDNVALIEDEILPIQEENYIIGKQVNGASSGNGELINASNNIIVNKDKIKVKNGDKIRWTYYTNNINFYLGLYKEDGTKITTYSANDVSGQRVITISNENAAYIIATYMIGSAASLGIEIEDTSSGTATWVQLWTPNNGGTIYQNSREVSYQKTDIANLKDRVYIKTNYKTGTWLRVSDTYGTNSGWNACLDYIRVRPGDKLDWTIGSTNSSFGMTVFDFNFEHIADFSANAVTRQLFMPNGAAYIKFCWAKNKTVDGQSVPNDNPLQINGVNVLFVIDYRGMENVIDLVAPPFSNDYGIIGKYYPEEMGYIETILNAKKANRFHFLHISDTHGSNFGYANELLDLCNAKFLINTGDLVYDQFSDKDLETFQTISLATSPTKPVYLVLGNHDYNKATSKQDIFDAFIAPTNTHNGTSFNKTYYSVNFATEKVKCIMLDQFEGFADADIATRTMNQLIWGKMSETQIRWFVSELQDAITNNYHVCVFIHAIPCPPDKHLRINDFCDKISGDSSLFITFLPQIIDAFITGSTIEFTYDGVSYSFTFASAGHFIAWFGGHTHYDMAGWMKDHTNQFMINVCQPFKNNATYFGVYDNDKLGVHFNYVTIDTSINHLSLFRVGQQKTIFATERKSFSVVYK